MTRVVFMGSPEFALPTLASLYERYEVVGVYTQPDKPAGRGQQLSPPPIKPWAQQQGLPVFQPRTLRDPSAQAQLADLKPDIIVVAAYGLLLPKPVLDLPPHGCINVHASLLPKYRGAAPIPAAILNGESRTGITLMRLDEGLDTGPMIAQASFAIGPDYTTGDVTVWLALLGAQLIVETLPRWMAGEITPQPQDESQATFAPKLDKEEGRLDWSRPAIELARRVRAFSPSPGSFTFWKGRLLRVLSVQAVGKHPPDVHGTVVKDGKDIDVVTGDGVLRLTQVQLEGKRAMSAADFARGQPSFIGSVLGA